MDGLNRLAHDYLVNKYNPHTIILYGSRARGDATETSDIDIACFCDDIVETKDARLFHDVYLDAWIYPTSYMESVPPEALRFSEGILLLDKKSCGVHYLLAVQERLKRGPEKLSTVDRDHQVKWIHKMLKRIRAGDLEGNYRKSWLRFQLLESYFTLRDLWFLGDKRSFIWLKENDLNAYQLFANLYSDTSDDDDLTLLAAYVTNF